MDTAKNQENLNGANNCKSKQREWSGITMEIWERGEQIEDRMWKDLEKYIQQKNDSQSK